jgi:ABC-type transporter MlaC component
MNVPMPRMTTAATLLALAGMASAANAVGAAAAAASAPATANPVAVDLQRLGPQELIQVSAQKMLLELDANRSTYRKDAAKLDALVATQTFHRRFLSFAAA